jgi:hypothetical protein
MEKLDWKRLYTTYTYSTTTSEIMDMKPAQCLSLTGNGEPSGKDFMEKIKALYATVYAIKFKWKQAGKDFMVPKVEVLRCGEGKIGGADVTYRLLIQIPEYVTESDVQKGIECVMDNMDIQLAHDIKMHRVGANIENPTLNH